MATINRTAITQLVQMVDGTIPTLVQQDERLECFIRRSAVICAIDTKQQLIVTPRAHLVTRLANDRVGFTPKDEYFDHYLRLVEDTVEIIASRR